MYTTPMWGCILKNFSSKMAPPSREDSSCNCWQIENFGIIEKYIFNGQSGMCISQINRVGMIYLQNYFKCLALFIAALIITLFSSETFAQRGSGTFTVTWWAGVGLYGGYQKIDDYIDSRPAGFMGEKCKAGGDQSAEYVSHTQPDSGRNVFITCWRGYIPVRSSTSIGLRVSASGGDGLDSQQRCPRWEGTYSSVGLAIADLVQRTDNCILIDKTYPYSQQCVTGPIDTTQGGKCDYGYRKNPDMGGGLDNVGGSVEWAKACLGGSYKDGDLCYCPFGQVWVSAANNGKGQCVSVQDKGPVSKPPNVCDLSGGNPIYPFKGTKREAVSTGISLGGHDLALVYDSAAAPWAVGAPLPGQIRIPGDLGSLWWSSLHKQLYPSLNGVSLKAARGSGATIDFMLKDGQWLPSLDGRTASRDQRDKLKATASGFVYFDQEGLALETYDTGGQLLSWTSLSGLTLQPTYSTGAGTSAPSAGYMVSLADPFGRGIGWTYSNEGIVSVQDPTGRLVKVHYTNGNLDQLTWQDDKTRGLVYDTANANKLWALTGIVDEDGKRFATFGYDAEGRAISTEHANGQEKFSVNYGSVGPNVVTSEIFDATVPVVRRYHDWALPQPFSMVEAGGAVVQVNLPDTSLYYPRYAGRLQPAGAGCAASTSYTSYDINGNKASEDDFNQHRTCYENDLSRNLETVRVEGLGNTASCSTALAGTSNWAPTTRKISTQWHPDWAIKTKQAEPFKLTTWVYNGQPDPFNGGATAKCAPESAVLPEDGSGVPKPIVVLCKQVEQATLDANGSQGLSPTLDSADPLVEWQATTNYTYNQYGQVLSKTGAKTSTSYVYYPETAFTGTDPNAVGHYKGDLQTVTQSVSNTKTLVTQYTAYDKAGRVLTMIDPNLVTTSYTYWPRGWLKTVTEAGETTQLEYWPTGLLKKVTQPDGSYLSYVYDDAHRLTDVSDNLGNTVHYVLNNDGKREGEEVKDTSTTLTRKITRTFDALSRLKTAIGAAQ